MKYVRFKRLGIVIFGPHIQHSTMASYVRDEVVSAGMVSLTDPPTCYGESVSLDLKSLPEDTNLLRASLHS